MIMMTNNPDRDAALCRLAVQGDAEAEDRLISEYSRLVRACARPYFLAGGDSEDLIQEGMMGLLSAIRTFEPERDVQFSTYAELCIKRRLYSAIKSAARNKHSPLNNYVTLESPELLENSSRRVFLRDPEEFVIAQERVNEITDGLYGNLSRFEAEVLRLYLDGMSYAEIADEMKKSTKSVDNAVQRIRRKLAQVFNYGGNQ